MGRVLLWLMQDRRGTREISGEVGRSLRYLRWNSLPRVASMTNSAVTLDAIDRKLLREVQRDGRASVVSLAERVGLSPTPCQRRLKRLEEGGVITGYAAVLDAPRLGLGLTAFVQVSLASRSEETVEAFHAAIGRMPEVLAAWAMSGETDYLLQVVAADLEAYGEFATRRLLRLPGVKDTKSAFVLRSVKPPAGLPVAMG
jgi:Lrp/AsnC family leucine-responsive transcriptional regulator